jgi:alkaline phosphatase
VHRRSALAFLVSLCLALLGADRDGPARNAILFVGDGMGVTTLTAARIHAGGPGHRLALELPNTALVRTHSLDRLVTDSAASAAAMLSGRKVASGTFGLSPEVRFRCSAPTRADGEPNPVHPCDSAVRPVPSLADLALEAGMAVGVVTTTTITHATPAALYAHSDDRNREADVARQLVERSDLSFVAGGGRRLFLPEGRIDGQGRPGGREDDRDLLSELVERGYAVAETGSGLREAVRAGAPKVVALLASEHLPFELQRAAGSDDVPSLAELTELAIRHLSRHEGGWLLVVEGGRIDHAQHGNLARLALEDAVAFDHAVESARRATSEEQTLILVTADHGHPLSIAGYALVDDPILGAARDFRGVDHADTDADGRPDPLRASDGKGMTTLLFGNGPGHGDPEAPGSGREDPLALGDGLLDPRYRQESAVPLPYSTHEGADVFLTGVGPGADRVRGFLDNTEVYRILRDALGLSEPAPPAPPQAP